MAQPRKPRTPRKRATRMKKDGEVIQVDDGSMNSQPMEDKPLELVDKSLNIKPRPEDEPVNEKEDGPGSSMVTGLKDYRKYMVSQMERRIAHAAEWWRETFEKGQRDVHRIYIDQWPESARAMRIAQQRPALTINSLPQYIANITSQNQQSTLGVRFIHAGGIEGPIPGAVDKMVKLSHGQIMSGIWRWIETDCDAPTKYARAAQHAAEAGIGWMIFRIMKDPNDPFVQKIFIDHIRNRWAVLTDPLAVQPDLSDMDYGFVTQMMPLQEFNARWPEYATHGHPLESFSGWTGDIAGHPEWWGNADNVRVIDYYFKVVVEKQFVELIRESDMTRIVNRKEIIGPYIDELVEGHGFTVKREMKSKVKEVRMVKAIRGQFLGKIHRWPGSFIPLVPCLGRQVDLYDKTQFLGLLHYAIEPAQMKDVWVSAATERAAQLPKDPWVVTTEQIANVKHQWDNLNTTNPQVLEYEHTEGHPPPFKAPARGDMPVAEMQMIETLRGSIQEAIGIYEANIGQKSNERTGVAIQRRQQAGQGTSFGFIYNTATMVRGVGMQAKELVPLVYNDDRLATIITDEGEELKFHINHYITDRETGKKFLYGALSLSQYSVRVNVGPSTVSQREEFWKMLESFAQSNPQIWAVAGDLFIKALNLPYGEAIVRRLRATLPPEFLTEAERQARPPKTPTPEENLAALKLKAEEVKAAGDIELVRMKLMEAAQSIDAAALKAMIEEAPGGEDEMMNKILQKIKQEVAQGLREFRATQSKK